MARAKALEDCDARKQVGLELIQRGKHSKALKRSQEEMMKQSRDLEDEAKKFEKDSSHSHIADFAADLRAAPNIWVGKGHRVTLPDYLCHSGAGRVS